MFSWYPVSVWESGNLLEMGGGDSCLLPPNPLHKSLGLKSLFPCDFPKI